MATITSVQLRLRSWLYEYGLGNTASATGLSNYYIRKCINDSTPSLHHIQRLVNYFENLDAEKEAGLKRLLG